MVNECNLVNESKPKNSQEKQRRNFLKENIQNLKNLKKKCNTFAGNKDNHVKQIETNRDSKIVTCANIKSKRIKDNNRNKDFGDTNELKELFVRKPSMSNQSVQTWDSTDGSYWDNVKYLTPSAHVLKSLSKHMETKALDNHSRKLQEHLSELNEYLEKGSISRRKGQSISSGSSKYISSERRNLPWRHISGAESLINTVPDKRCDDESLKTSLTKYIKSSIHCDKELVD